MCLLAESEYRHALETTLDPFKGLLLGLFFIAVGMQIDLRLMWDQPFTILALTAALLTVKISVLWAIGRGSGLSRIEATRLAIVLAQGGEFAFILFAMSTDTGLLEPAIVDPLTMVVTLSMASTPILLELFERWASTQHERADQTYEAPDHDEPKVIIAGFGRYGQMTARLLNVYAIPFTALDRDSKQIEFVRRFGSKAYFGNPTDLDLLKKAGADLRRRTGDRTRPRR